MSRQAMMMRDRAPLAAGEAEIGAKQAEISSLKAAREAAEAKLEVLNHTKRKIEEEHGHLKDEPEERDEQIG